MMDRRRIWSGLFCGFAVVLGLAMGGCGREPEVVRIGIGQYIDHPSLDEVRNGFLEEMIQQGFTDGSTAHFDYRNAQGDAATTRDVAQKFVDDRCDLIFAIATPMSQAVQKATASAQIPVVFGAITDPVSAGLASSLDHPGGNMTGTSDQWPYYEQLALLKELLPNVRTVGVILNPGEANTQYAMEQTRSAAASLGLELVEAPVTGTAEVYEAAQSLASRCNAYYVPADNTAMAAAPTIVKVANEHRLPVLAGDPSTFEAGCVAGLGVSYRQLGVESARLAVKILRENASPGELPVVVSGEPVLMLNLEVARSLGITVPQTIVDRAERTVGEEG